MIAYRMTFYEFKDRFENNEMVDISNELQAGFLVAGQFMRALIIWRDIRYYATGWYFPGAGYAYVDLMPQGN